MRLTLQAQATGPGAQPFSLSADGTTTGRLFVRDMPFLFHGKRLEGERTFGDTRIQVTFTRQ
jgi:hypothetical protein